MSVKPDRIGLEDQADIFCEQYHSQAPVRRAFCHIDFLSILVYL